MRYCGIDVSAAKDGQQLCTLHERRGADAGELVATFYSPGTVEQVARTVRGFGGEAVAAIDAPSGHRLDLLAAGAPLRTALRLPEGRYERARVCDALLFRRRLPLYPVPSAGGGAAGARWQAWLDAGFGLYEALAPLGLYAPPDPKGVEGPLEDGAMAHGRVCET